MVFKRFKDVISGTSSGGRGKKANFNPRTEAFDPFDVGHSFCQPGAPDPELLQGLLFSLMWWSRLSKDVCQATSLAWTSLRSMSTSQRLFPKQNAFPTLNAVWLGLGRFPLALQSIPSRRR